MFPNLSAELWGPGSIEVDGEGTVEDASVVYSYRYDTCFDPQSDPSCLGYEETVEVPRFRFTTLCRTSSCKKTWRGKLEYRKRKPNKKGSVDESNGQSLMLWRTYWVMEITGTYRPGSRSNGSSTYFSSTSYRLLLGLDGREYFDARMEGGIYPTTRVQDETILHNNCFTSRW